MKQRRQNRAKHGEIAGEISFCFSWSFAHSFVAKRTLKNASVCVFENEAKILNEVIVKSTSLSQLQSIYQKFHAKVSYGSSATETENIKHRKRKQKL